MGNENPQRPLQTESSIPQEADVRGRLTRAVLTLIDQRRLAEQEGLAPGAVVAEIVLQKNAPVLDYITDGDLRQPNRTGFIETRVDALPDSLAVDTLARIETTLTIAKAAPSVASTRRLAAYLPVVMPTTREGLEALRFIASGYEATCPLPEVPGLAANIEETVKVLAQLDNEVFAEALKDSKLMKEVQISAMEVANLRLPKLMTEESEQVAKLRVVAAQRKLTQLRREYVQVPGAKREYSRFEILANEIIEARQLTDETESVKKSKQEALEKAKGKAINRIVRSRAIRRVITQLGDDPQFCEAIAKRQRMTAEELLAAGENVKTVAANNALVAIRIVISTEDKRVFVGQRIFDVERQKLIDELQDGLGFVANLSPEEIKAIQATIPKTSDAKSVFDTAKELLRIDLEKMATFTELATILAEGIAENMARNAVEQAVDQVVLTGGTINRATVIQKVAQVVRESEGIVKVAVSILKRSLSGNIMCSIRPRVETEQPKKPYEFVVPTVTIGKSQLVSPDNLLRFGTGITMARSAAELEVEVQRLIDGSREFEQYFSSTDYKRRSQEKGADMFPLQTADFYPPEKKAEMLFSMVGRGAGSKLAGTPLFELRTDLQGVVATLDPTMDQTLRAEITYGTRSINNSVRLSPLVATIGQPYTDRLMLATQIVADAIDTVSANARAALSGRNNIGVEHATDIIREELDKLLNTPADNQVPGRSVIQMDYFLLYPPAVRRKILETFQQTGSIETIQPLLSSLTSDGKMGMTIFDISGGSGGVGISELLSQRVFGRGSGHMQAYLDALLGSYESQTGRLPERVLIVPRQADLTLMDFEYTVVEKALKARGVGVVGITTIEMLQQSLEVARKNKQPLHVPTLGGNIITPELIVKRFTFLNEGKGTGYRGYIPLTLPAGVVLEPNNLSRIVASDKRINSAILYGLEPRLRPLGVEVMPYLELNIQGPDMNDLVNEVVSFMEVSKEKYPEIDFLGAVLKTVDKIPGREGRAGEVISAYPIPASVMESTQMQRLFIARKIRELTAMGVTGIIVQPNILSLMVDNNGILMPKYELKMMAFASKRR